MNHELIINGLRIDLSPNIVIATTYQANNIGELQNRQGTYTNNFEVPINQLVALNLEFSHLMTSGSLIPYRLLDATYIRNGIEIISDGIATIKFPKKGFATISVVSGNVSLSDAMGDATVGELFLNDTPFEWSTNSAFISRDKSQYYIFPLINWRPNQFDEFDTPLFNVQRTPPCALMTSIFSRLSNYTGLSFSGNYIESDEHKNMILTPDQYTVNPLYLPQDQTKGSLVYDPNTYTLLTEGYFLGSTLIEEDSGVNYASIYPIQNTFDAGFSNNAYTPLVDQIGRLKFNSLLNINWFQTENYGSFENQQTKSMYIVSRMYKTLGTVLVAETTSPVITSALPLQNESVPVELDTGNISLDSSTYYFVVHDLVVESHTNIESRVYVNAFNSDFVHTPTDIIEIGSDLHFKDIFRMKVKDVFKDILNLRGLIIQTNSYTKNVQFNFFQDVIDNIPIAKDWGDKVDSRAFGLGFTFGDYAQKNWMKFKENDSVEDGLGDYYFTIDDETLEKEKTVVQIGHPATESKPMYLGKIIPQINGFNEVGKWQKPNYRILELSIENTSYDVTFNDGVNTDEVTNESIPFAKFKGFEELIPENYLGLLNMLDKTKAIKIPFRLTPIDISEIDFTIPIFLDVPELNLNGHFYLNKIENYRGDITSCELIRL